jgi:hypothetical protein
MGPHTIKERNAYVFTNIHSKSKAIFDTCEEQKDIFATIDKKPTLLFYSMSLLSMYLPN